MYPLSWMQNHISKTSSKTDPLSFRSRVVTNTGSLSYNCFEHVLMYLSRVGLATADIGRSGALQARTWEIISYIAMFAPFSTLFFLF